MHHAYRRGELLRHLKFRSKVDAINFLAASAPDLSKRQFKRAFGARGFPLHDPRRAELEAIAPAPLMRLEVAVDAIPSNRVRPKLEASPELWRMFMRQTYALLTENLFPWAGPGIPVDWDPWSYGERGDRLRTYTRPEAGETFYFGREEHPAQLKIYWKVRDQGTALPLRKQTIRIELRLNEKGCRAAGLNNVGDLLDYKFRSRLRPYFHAVRPVVRPGLFRRAPAPMRALLRDRADRELQTLVREVGAHALRSHAWAYTGKGAAYGELNRRLGDALKNVV